MASGVNLRFPGTRPSVIDPSELFRIKLNGITTFGKDTKEEVVEQLSGIIPAGMEPQEIINIIFESINYQGTILRLLDSVQLLYPAFTFSPFDKIRRAIIEDEKHQLDNTSIIRMIKECNLCLSEKDMDVLYDLAYRMNHPNIFRSGHSHVPACDYTLNFLWVNLEPQDRVQNVAQNIFRDGLGLYENDEIIIDPNLLRQYQKTEQSLEGEALQRWSRIKKTYSYKIARWAEANPNAQINLWFDSALVTEKALRNTFEMMKLIAKSRGVNIRLRDIRVMPNITGEIKKSLHPGTQLYYRVDMLKVLIADYMISSEEKSKYCVVSDFDVEPMTPEQLFDDRTLTYLSSNGYVFNRVGVSNFENSFFIFDKEKNGLQRKHYQTMIESIEFLLADLRTFSIGSSFRSEWIIGHQRVFAQYSEFRKAMNEGEQYTTRGKLLIPRKVVKCPPSQFNCGGSFPKSDFKAETFRFIGNSDVPYTLYGRNNGDLYEGQIPWLISWKAEPLDLPQ